jgi:hypothetical protein
MISLPPEAPASQLRQDLRRELNQLLVIAETFFERGTLVPGQVYETRRRCGKPSCHCMQEGGHAICLLSVLSPEGRKTRSLSAAAKAGLLPLVERYRHFREARAAFVRTTKEVLRLADALGEALTATVDLDGLKEA